MKGKMGAYFGETSLVSVLWNYLLLLLLLELLEVEVELITFKDVSIGSSRLTWSGGDASQQSAALELIGDSLFQTSIGVSGSELSLNVTRLLDLLWGWGVSLLGEIDTVVLQVPLSEWGGINLNNGVLGQSLGTNVLRV